MNTITENILDRLDEIGDTPKGRKFIRGALAKRAAQIKYLSRNAKQLGNDDHDTVESAVTQHEKVRAHQQGASTARTRKEKQKAGRRAFRKEKKLHAEPEGIRQPRPLVIKTWTQPGGVPAGTEPGLGRRLQKIVGRIRRNIYGDNPSDN